ncbi:MULTISPECIES: mevalonate kinase [unclassified Ligilactobacillus]|uniref:mevalonate kinase n=1 Tax=unclassified Ligilactobacillus TaxID=2767920 RepID=UPI0038537F13
MTPQTGTSNAKIILAGEHAVVYGEPAIALPLTTVQAQATFRPQAGQATIHSSYYDGPVVTMPPTMNGVHALLNQLMADVNYRKGYDLTINSALPAERGMGSSAAVAVAIIRAAFRFFNRPLNHQQLLTWAAVAEKITHKNPSGLDAATTASTNPVWLIRGHEPHPLSINVNAALLICDSGIKGKTSAAIMRVKEHLTSDPRPTRQHLHTIGTIVREMKDALAANAVPELGRLMNANQTELRALGVSSPQLDKLITLARQNGALGSKLTGGGCGGCFINLVPDTKTARRLATLLSAHGVTATWIEPLTLVPKENEE